MSVWAVLACRAQSERLYCKPLQQIAGQPILNHIVENIRRLEVIDGIVLAVAEGRANHCFLDCAEVLSIPYVIGPEQDILARALTAIRHFDIDTMFRITTECPFLYMDGAGEIIRNHVQRERDFTTILSLPLGATYELIGRSVLEKMASTENPRYRGVLSRYVREHVERLNVATLLPSQDCRRPDVNLAVDHPGQLLFCRHAFSALVGRGLPISISDLIRYYDCNPVVSSLVKAIHEDVFRVKADHSVARVWE